MNSEPMIWPHAQTLLMILALAPTVLYALAAGCARDLKRSWTCAHLASGGAMVAAFLCVAWVLMAGPATLPGWTLVPLASGGELRWSLRLDAVTGSVLLLVSFLGWVITRYSRTYLEGEPHQPRFVRSLVLTLAAVSTVVVSNNLGVLVLAWIATTLSLHRLLTFYSDRPQALWVARKKALAGRVAELCLLLAVGLVGARTGSLEIDQLQPYVAQLIQTDAGLPWDLHFAALLFAVAAILKCAQLPVHGWLIQVMEAPTPVSALLHAGVVNLGGLVLIRLAPLVSEAPVAQTLLVVVGSVTAVVAALVVMTRISVKVSLAWSTCAQMGFMLMQCGLGAYGLALLHLLAHSLYKAHAFLAAGSAVEQTRLQRLMPQRAPQGWGASAVAVIGSLAVVIMAAAVWNFVAARLFGAAGLGAVNGTALVLTGIFCLALSPWFMSPTGRMRDVAALARVGTGFVLALVYFALHAAVNLWMDAPTASPPSVALMGVVGVSFGLLFVMQSWIRAQPQAPWVQRLYPWFFAGLHLDEWFTRLTWRVWPLRTTTAFEMRSVTSTSATSSGAL